MSNQIEIASEVNNSISASTVVHEKQKNKQMSKNKFNYWFSLLFLGFVGYVSAQTIEIKDSNYRIEGRVDGNVIKDKSYNVIGRIDGDVIKDKSYNIIARIDGNVIKDKSYNVIGRVSGTPSRSQWIAILIIYIM